MGRGESHGWTRTSHVAELEWRTVALFAGLVQVNQPAGSPLEIQSVSAATVFFSHTKPAETVFFSQVSDQRTGPVFEQ